MFDMDWNSECDCFVNIKIIGVGKTGGKAVNYLINRGLDNAEFIAMDSEEKVLEKSLAPTRLKIGDVGIDVKIDADEELVVKSREVIFKALNGADMVYVITGQDEVADKGNAPLVASYAKENGALTVGVITTSSEPEGAHDYIAEDMASFKNRVDTLICIPHDCLMAEETNGEHVSDDQLFIKANEFVYNIIKCISDLISTPGLINLDFDDVKSLLSNAGTAIVGAGVGTGKNAAVKAAEKAINSPIVKDKIKEVKGVLLNVIGSEEKLSMFEVNEAAQTISDATNNSANIIWGAAVDNTLGDAVKVVIVAAGFDQG